MYASGGVPKLTVEQKAELIGVYCSFINRFSDENPSWKTDVSLNADVANPPDAPYKLHYNDTLGYYTYRPKQWSELTDYEKFAVENDPRLPHYIKEVYGKATPQTSSMPAAAEAKGAPVTRFHRPFIMKSVEDTAPASPVTETVYSPKVEPIKQQKGILSQTDGVFRYQFSPEELISTTPIRLIEVK